MKKFYESPIVEITVFDVEDVITTSAAVTTSVDTLTWTPQDADAATHKTQVGADAVGYYSSYTW